MSTPHDPTFARLNQVEEQIARLYHAAHRAPVNPAQIAQLRQQQAALTAQRRVERAIEAARRVSVWDSLPGRE